MELVTMGKVTVEAKIENLSDLYAASRGFLPEAEIRSIVTYSAVVDTGATTLAIPKHLIAQLGLRHVRTKRGRTPVGLFDFRIFEAVRLTVQGRQCVVEVSETHEETPVLIGQLPLESLDFLVDPVNQRLIGNPDHNGEDMIDLF